ncbi:hypothetical protein BASA83_005180 [Batrachochytrium salamandrivorans]|nr:hypothetical protein BASA83_005180 [Batrachochytrium salamandrivorans]
MQRLGVAESYRALLRAQRITFSGDSKRLVDGAYVTRLEYLKHKDERDPLKIAQLVQIAHQARNIIAKNLVQGVRTAENADTYALRITSETEINSNDSIKKAPKGKIGSGCCQST